MKDTKINLTDLRLLQTVLSGELRPSSLDLPVVTDGPSCPASSAPTPWIYRWSQTLMVLSGELHPQLPGSTGSYRLSGELRPSSPDLPVVTDDPSCPASSAPTPRIYPGGHGRPSCDWTGRETEWVGGEVMGPPPPARRPRPAQLGRYFRDQLTRSDVRGASIAIIADSGGALARFRRRGSLGRQSAAQRPAELAAVDLHRRDGVVAPASIANPTIDANMCRTQ